MSDKKSQSYPLKSDECVALLNGEVKFITYPELKNYKSMDELLYPYNRVILLYMHTNDYGHYTAISKSDRHPDTISFFDSYNYSPDEEFSFIEDYTYNYETIPYLTNLLVKSGYKVDKNPIHLQSDDENVATCGRWVCLRLFFKELTNEEFADMMLKASNAEQVSPDELATELTSIYL